MLPIAGNIRNCKTQTESSVKWSLNNYRVHENYYGKGVVSPEFQVANYGKTFMKFQHVEQYAVVDLNVPEELDIAGMTFKIFIIDESDVKMGTSGSELIGHVPCHVSERHSSVDGKPYFIRNPIIARSEILTKKGCLCHDTLTLLCKITIIERKKMKKNTYHCYSSFDDDSIHNKSKNNEEIIENVSIVAKPFEEFFNAPDFSDLTISVENRIFHVHKIILAAHSPVFRAMFTTQMTEKNENLVKINDVSCETFQIFLKSLYAGSIATVENHIGNILILADRYQVESLKNLCENYITNNLKSTNVIEYLILAHSYGFINLKKSSMMIAISCGKQITMYPDFHKLCSYPDLLAEIMQSMM